MSEIQELRTKIEAMRMDAEKEFNEHPDPLYRASCLGTHKACEAIMNLLPQEEAKAETGELVKDGYTLTPGTEVIAYLGKWGQYRGTLHSTCNRGENCWSIYCGGHDYRHADEADLTPIKPPTANEQEEL